VVNKSEFYFISMEIKGIALLVGFAALLCLSAVNGDSVSLARSYARVLEMDSSSDELNAWKDAVASGVATEAMATIDQKQTAQNEERVDVVDTSSTSTELGNVDTYPGPGNKGTPGDMVDEGRSWDEHEEERRRAHVLRPVTKMVKTLPANKHDGLTVATTTKAAPVKKSGKKEKKGKKSKHSKKGKTSKKSKKSKKGKKGKGKKKSQKKKLLKGKHVAHTTTSVTRNGVKLVPARVVSADELGYHVSGRHFSSRRRHHHNMHKVDSEPHSAHRNSWIHRRRHHQRHRHHPHHTSQPKAEEHPHEDLQKLLNTNPIASAKVAELSTRVLALKKTLEHDVETLHTLAGVWRPPIHPTMKEANNVVRAVLKQLHHTQQQLEALLGHEHDT